MLVMAEPKEQAETVGLVCRKCGCADLHVRYGSFNGRIMQLPKGKYREKICRNCGSINKTYEVQASKLKD